MSTQSGPSPIDPESGYRAVSKTVHADAQVPHADGPKAKKPCHNPPLPVAACDWYLDSSGDWWYWRQTEHAWIKSGWWDWGNWRWWNGAWWEWAVEDEEWIRY